MRQHGQHRAAPATGDVHPAAPGDAEHTSSCQPNHSSCGEDSRCAARAAQQASAGQQDCPYLPERRATLSGHAFIQPGSLPPADYDQLLSENFRRAGVVVYRPRCRGCSACKSLRVPVATFAPTKSMRRVLRLNEDVDVRIAAPDPSMESYDVYRRYLELRHDRTMSDDFVSFASFLYVSPTLTQEITYRLGDRLLAISIVDRVPSGLSSVYVFFDPEFADRSPGTFSALWEIDYCRREELPYYYLGYHVTGARTMEYKARFRPNEILSEAGEWTPFRT
ncbi:MAG: arginyltransferase [Phycisphaerales bacterium]|nr:arginyltransferase [Phycisphaerales bacterium]